MSVLELENEVKEVVSYFQNLIRIDTTNPPGNELAACRYLADILTKEKIPFEIVEPSPGRASLIARLKGDGSQKPLLLTGHLDVVPAEREAWSCDPFSGQIKDGFVWGRGAVDMKNMVALSLGILLKVARSKISLKRDLIFAAIADEEAGCTWGSKWLVENRPELVQAEYALNEVGGFSLAVHDTTFYPIGVAEKGVCWFKITATGTPGHGAMPHGDQALPHLCLAAHKLSKEGLPFHAPKIVRRFIGEVAARLPLLQGLALKQVTRGALSDYVTDNLIPDKSRARNFRNMVHNLATPTKMQAGQAVNVIPSQAELWVDGRILPETTVAAFLDEVKTLIGPDFTIDILTAEEALQTPHDNDFFTTLGDVLRAHDPGSVPVPFLIPGYTDAKNYSKLGIKCYGFVPIKLPQDLNFGALFHGHDERLPVSAIEFGLKVMWDVVQRTCV
jgi:acetylornithine deacetylase/succinyl-diaminopimelate desuccinylase-like protein